jgi:nucleotide-binding universal stress UspA family protein
MIRSILVLLDGSAFSAQVIPCAVSAARALNAHIEFVQVHIPAYPHSWLADVAEDDLRWELETQQQEREELERVAARVTAEWGIPARFQLLEGEVVASIVHRAREVNAVMIVLATHGRTGFSRAVFGSLADRMIPLSQIPILLFHPRQELEAKAAVEPFGHILIPLDGSPLSETAIPFALTLGRTTAKYTLMRVVPSADLLAVSPPVLAALRDPRDTKKDQDAMDDLLRIADDLVTRGYETDVFIEAHPQPAVAIMQHAYECGADAIAISTHGRHGLARAALGSVTDQLVRDFRKPVLVYRPQAVAPRPGARRTEEAGIA